jgi:Tol biopolymer transport system component
VDVVFDSRHEGFGAVYVVSADGGRPRRLTPENSNSMMPSWSWDGRFVYFASDRSGSWQVWRQPLSGGDAVQITRKGGREAKESPDGRFVYYGGLGPVGLWKVSVAGGDEAAIPEFEKVSHRRYWALTDRGIYYLSSDRAPWTISFFDFATRLTKPVFTSPGKPVFGTPGLTVSPDGQSMLYSQVNREGSDILLLENFE